VNAGPLSYAQAFTHPEQKKRYGDDVMLNSELAFRKLMSVCEKALQLNGIVIAGDQQTYHEVLLSSFEAVHERLSGFFGKSLCLILYVILQQLIQNPIDVSNKISGFQFRDVQFQETTGEGQKSTIRVLDTINGVTATS
ncbi:hypothetical protein KIN20_021355, partial [Parelaphostrongylus tenuis]